MDLLRVLDAVHRRRPHRGGRGARGRALRPTEDTIVLSMVTGHARHLYCGRRSSSTLKGNQGAEYELLDRLREVMPSGVKVTVLADRGFADWLFYALATAVEYVIRLRGDVYVTNARGERRLAAAWVGAGGRARRLVGARVTERWASIVHTTGRWRNPGGWPGCDRPDAGVDSVLGKRWDPASEHVSVPALAIARWVRRASASGRPQGERYGEAADACSPTSSKCPTNVVRAPFRYRGSTRPTSSFLPIPYPIATKAPAA